MIHILNEANITTWSTTTQIAILLTAALVFLMNLLQSTKKKWVFALYRTVAASVAFALLLASFAGGITACSGGAGTVDASVSGPQKGVIYYLDDHLGNTHLITDSQGTVLHEVKRNPNGLEKNSESTDDAVPDIDYVYTGKEYDRETGLVYFGERYYSPEMGRWITPDPLYSDNEIKLQAIKLPQEFNLYEYARNNPISYIDPDGFASLKTDMTHGITTFDPRPEDPKGLPYTITTRNAVIRNTNPGAQDAFKTIDVTVIDTIHHKSYGPKGAYIDTGDPRGRDIHGGGNSRLIKDPFAPRQGWAPTKGCTRGQNEDIIELGDRIQDFQKRHPDVKIPYERYKDK